jgi:hypothetical protein
VTEPLTCDRCHRLFGGWGAFRRGHVFRRGAAVRCRRISDVRRRLRLGDDGVWHYPAPTDTGQLRLALFGRGRPRKGLPTFFVGTRNRRIWLVRPTGRRSPRAELLEPQDARIDAA